jgi:hypothetical protein
MFGECPRCPSLYEGIYFGRFKWFWISNV